MTKPPRLRPGRPEARAPSRDPKAQGWRRLLELQRALARSELGLETSDEPGDAPGETMFSISALIGHVLTRHQQLYADEAYLGTAKTARSLVEHGRRLGWRPAPGLSATGVVALTVREGLSGVLPAGLALSSAPRGEAGAEPFETLEPRRVDAALNRVSVRGATQPRYTATDTSVTVAGVGHGLREGELVVLAPIDGARAGLARRVVRVEESPRTTRGEARTTTLILDAELGPAIHSLGPWRLHAKARERVPMIGHDAPTEVSRSVLETVGSYDDELSNKGEASEVTGWTSPPDITAKDVLLARSLERSLAGEPLVFFVDGGHRALALTPDSERNVVVTLVHHRLADGLDGVQTKLHGSATRVRLIDETGEAVGRGELAPGGVLLCRWARILEPVTTAPATTVHKEGQVLTLAGELKLAPGMSVVLTTRARPGERRPPRAQQVVLTQVDVRDGDTQIVWRRRSVQDQDYEWTLGDLEVLGNVVAVGHGERVEQILGSSDGVTPSARFGLERPRVSHRAASVGAAPIIELRVGAAVWTRVADFGSSGPDDRHYCAEIDAEQRMTIGFGDGRRGAIPAAGRDNLTVSYRVGLGRAGEVEAGRLNRLASAHPLIEAVHNPLPTRGGAEPSEEREIRAQATREVRTLGRAVSVEDYADLALLHPGVARACARWDGEGVALTVADPQGRPLYEVGGLLAFLNARRDLSVGLTLQPPRALRLHLGLLIKARSGHERGAVEAAVREALLEAARPGLFTFAGRELGQGASRGRLLAHLDAVAGVEAVDVLHFALTATPQRVDEDIEIAAHEWLSLAPADLALTLTTAELGP